MAATRKASNVRSAVTGDVYIGDAHAGDTIDGVKTVPDGLTALGYLSDDGFKIKPERKTDDLKAWQNADVVEVAGKQAKAAVVLRRQDRVLRPHRLGGADPLVDVQARGREGVNRGSAVVVFDVEERLQPEVDEHSQLAPGIVRQKGRIVDADLREGSSDLGLFGRGQTIEVVGDIANGVRHVRPPFR